jgi:hypothetical protein
VSTAAAALFPLVLVGAAALCGLAAGCAGRDAVVRWEDVSPAARDPAPSVAVASTTSSPDASDARASAAPRAAAPAAPAPRTSAIVVDGRPVDDGAIVDMPRLELACLPAADALTAPREARERFLAAAARFELPIGRLTFVVLERDPARSLTDPPPSFCRTIPVGTELRAPLRRQQEPARRWLIRRIATGLVADASALVKTSTEKKLAAAAPPRVLVDDEGALVALALPVEGDS